MKAALAGSILVICFCLAPCDALAQTRLGAIEVAGGLPLAPVQISTQPHWGTSSESVEVLLALNFTAESSANTWAQSQQNLYGTSGVFQFFDANVDIPSGAEITYFEIEGCDTSSTALIGASLYAAVSPGSLVYLLGEVSTTDAATPGCVFVGQAVTAPQRFVDKLGYRYAAEIYLNGTNFNAEVGALRVYYKLRVSPAPNTATFADVPTTHLFFQYVEALAAAGITSGCGGGNFCPDAAVTRGQMAVFLSKALGLHWTP